MAELPKRGERAWDALVAEKVMGSVPCGAWKLWGSGLAGGEYTKAEGDCEHKECHPSQQPPRYDNVAWDYSVLVRVRKEWSSDDVEEFAYQIQPLVTWWLRL